MIYNKCRKTEAPEARQGAPNLSQGNEKLVISVVIPCDPFPAVRFGRFLKDNTKLP